MQSADPSPVARRSAAPRLSGSRGASQGYEFERVPLNRMMSVGRMTNACQARRLSCSVLPGHSCCICRCTSARVPDSFLRARSGLARSVLFRAGLFLRAPNCLSAISVRSIIGPRRRWQRDASSFLGYSTMFGLPPGRPTFCLEKRSIKARLILMHLKRASVAGRFRFALNAPR